MRAGVVARERDCAIILRRSNGRGGGAQTRRGPRGLRVGRLLHPHRQPARAEVRCTVDQVARQHEVVPGARPDARSRRARPDGDQASESIIEGGTTPLAERVSEPVTTSWTHAQGDWSSMPTMPAKAVRRPATSHPAPAWRAGVKTLSSV